MLVCQNDFMQVGRDGDIVVFEVFDPGAVILDCVGQSAKYLACRNRDRLGLMGNLGRGDLSRGFVLGTVVDTQSVLHC